MRWLLKKAMRHSMAAGMAAGNQLAQQFPTQSGPNKVIRTVTYHRFGDVWPFDAFCVTAKNFEAQMRWLAESELAISLADLELFVAGDKTTKPGSILVTIDDGVESVSTVAAPILERYQIPAVVFVSTNLVGNEDAAREQLEPYMDWRAIARLLDMGLTIGSHACSHTSLGKMSISQAQNEAETSRDTLQKKLGIDVTSFAYPFGTPTHYSDKTTRVLEDVGYRTAFLSLHGPITPGLNPLELPRVKVEGGEGLWMFQQVCRGSMDPWATVDYAVSAVRSLRA